MYLSSLDRFNFFCLFSIKCIKSNNKWMLTHKHQNKIHVQIVPQKMIIGLSATIIFEIVN